MAQPTPSAQNAEEAGAFLGQGNAVENGGCKRQVSFFFVSGNQWQAPLRNVCFICFAHVKDFPGSTREPYRQSINCLPFPLKVHLLAPERNGSVSAPPPAIDGPSSSCCPAAAAAASRAAATPSPQPQASMASVGANSISARFQVAYKKTSQHLVSAVVGLFLSQRKKCSSRSRRLLKKIHYSRVYQVEGKHWSKMLFFPLLFSSL